MAAQDMCMRLLWAALACYMQRRLANDDDLRAKWAANLSTVLEVGTVRVCVENGQVSAILG